MGSASDGYSEESQHGKQKQPAIARHACGRVYSIKKTFCLIIHVFYSKNIQTLLAVQTILSILALFTAINKDTAELYHELAPFDAALAQAMSDKAVRIIRATEAGELLPRIAQSPGFHECRFCDWQDRCWSLDARGQTR